MIFNSFFSEFLSDIFFFFFLIILNLKKKMLAMKETENQVEILDMYRLHMYYYVTNKIKMHYQVQFPTWRICQREYGAESPPVRHFLS